MTARGTLSRELVISAAAAVADRNGINAVSMRTVGAELGVKAMSIYHHVSDKEALLDALAEWVFAQIALPVVGDPWREAMTTRAVSARAVLGQHPWGLGMLESRPVPGPALMRHHDRVVGCLMSQGFSALLATHAFSTLDAYIYGFVLTEVSLPFAAEGETEADFAARVAPSEAEYPHLARALEQLFAQESYAFSDEFLDGLNLILDGLAQRLAAAQGYERPTGADPRRA
ncbi:TetR/AcrR family transcriptional regulator [Microbacterium sp. NPDC076911]|uniref:TetR/AcrR family transcriptional regulator n=1 Tax=Microbacterium sp. NPDC076911 TaxID=3154958 RepID=UPI003441FA18